MTTLRSLLLATLLAAGVTAGAGGSLLDDIPARSEVLDGYREDSIRARLATEPLHAVEGLWEVAGEGSLMAVTRTSTPGLYVMAAVRAADPAVRPGTVMGYLTAGAKRGSYDTRIYSSADDSGRVLVKPGKYEATLADDGATLAIRPYGRKLRINWWRLLLPYMYRHLVTQVERNADLQGFRRVYPEPMPPLNPRYL